MNSNQFTTKQLNSYSKVLNNVLRIQINQQKQQEEDLESIPQEKFEKQRVNYGNSRVKVIQVEESTLLLNQSSNEDTLSLLINPKRKKKVKVQINLGEEL